MTDNSDENIKEIECNEHKDGEEKQDDHDHDDNKRQN